MSVAAKRRLRAPARRSRILGAALEAFASRGYRATAMGEIAVGAGVSRAVLYDHFRSKKDLFLAVLEEQTAVFVGHVGARITGSGTARDRMRETMEAVFSFAERHPDPWRLLFRNAPYGDPEIDAVASHVHHQQVSAVGALLAEDARRAGIDPQSPRAEIIVEMLIGALCGAVEWRREHPGGSVDELVDAGTDLLWTGLGGLESPGRR